jgi:ubiquinone/menaquinone biosynthesis C-methylase UbiE
MSVITGYKKNWYKEWFGEEYLAVYEHRDEEDASSLVDLIRARIQITAQTSILDVACGAGRHATIFSESTSCVYGIDLSMKLLRQAQQQGTLPYLIRGDMRRLPFSRKFDLVFSLFTSFGYFEDDNTNQQVAHEMSRVLSSEGNLVIDYLNPEYVIENLVPEGERRAGDLFVFERRWVSDRRIHKMIRLKQDGAYKTFHESVRLYSHEEMESILGNAGIRIAKTFGEYDGSSYHSKTSRMILFGKKE